MRNVCLTTAALALALALAACGDDTPPTCSSTQTSCSGKCVNTSQDPLNCGACSKTCDTAKGETCNSGKCEGCAAPKLACSGSCIDPLSDNANCGVCATTCDTAAGLTCVAGKCGCSGGQTSCGTPAKCVVLISDPANCGACGKACDLSKGESCSNGTCGGCVAPKLSCAGSCIDPQSDNANCGTCSTKCDTTAGLACVSGKCSCIGSQTACGTPPVCTDVNVDAKNCGGCGKPCAATETCQGGTCKPGTCPGTQKLCNGLCVDITADINNCSDCSIKCTGGKTCLASKCGCATGQTDCTGICADLTKDVANCGACGTKCAAAEVCTGTPPKCGSSCPTGQKACAGACVTVASDPNNCTDCAIKCTGGKICNNGCVCTTGQTDCTGTCADLKVDDKNCGACAKVCAATETCQNSACVTATLTSLQVNCATTSLPVNAKTQCTANGVLAGGSTVPLTTDAKLTWTVILDPTSPVGCIGIVPGSFSTTTKGEFQVANNATLASLGCRALITATYVGATQTITSNTVTITIRDKKITGVTITPSNPQLPALACVTANFRIFVSYDSGETLPLASVTAPDSITWLNMNPAVATFATYDGTTRFSNSTALTAGSAEIRATVILGGTTYNPTAQLTVVGSTMTGLAIVPKTPAAVPAGNTVAFTAIATFNGTTQFDVTYLGPSSDPYIPVSGCSPATFVHTSGSHILPAAPSGAGVLTFSATTKKYGYVFTAGATPTGADPADVVTLSWGGSTDTANVTVSNGVLVNCIIRTAGSDITAPADLLDGTTWPKGLTKRKMYTFGHYSNGDYVDITDSVTWTSDKPNIANVNNTAGAKGEIDMLLAGTAKISADPTALRPGVPICTANITIATAQVCKLYVLPRYRNDTPNEYRRAFRGAGSGSDPHASSTNGPGLGDLNTVRPLLPNEDGFVQKYRALAFYCTAATCPAGATVWGPTATSLPPTGAAIPANCYPIDVTSAATWATKAATGSPAVGLAYSGTPGSFTVTKSADAANWRREDEVSASVPISEGSTTPVVTKLNALVCGSATPVTAKMYSDFTDLLAVTTVASVAKGNDDRYLLVNAFKSGTNVCDFTAAPVGLTVNGYLLNVSEEATAWTATPAGVVAVNTAADSKGNLNATALGTASVTGTYAGSNASLDFTVTGAVVATCAITPTSGSMIAHTSYQDSIQFAVTATLTDNSKADYTTAVATAYAVYDSPTATTHATACADFSTTIKGRLLAASSVTGACPQYVAATIGAIRCTPCGSGDTACPTNTARPVITVNPATVSDYFLQVANRSCLEAVVIPTVSINTSIVLKGCIKWSNGAIVEDSTGPSTWTSPQPTILATDGNPETNWGRFKALGSTGPVTVTAQRTFTSPAQTFNPTMAIPLSAATISAVAITSPNHKDVLTGSNCTQLGLNYEYCEASGNTQRYQVLGTRAGLPPQDLTFMAAFSGNAGSCGSSPWTVPSIFRERGFLTATASGTDCDSDLTAVVTFVDATTLTSPAASATVRILAAAPSASLTVTVTPNALTGAAKTATLTATSTVTVGSLFIPVDLTTSTNFSADVPQAIWLAPGFAAANYHEHARILSRTVTVATPVKITGNYRDLGTQIGQATLTINP